MVSLGVAYLSGIANQDCDKLAIRSQQKWGEAKKNGVFDLEITPVEIESKKGTKVNYVLDFNQIWL